MKTMKPPFREILTAVPADFQQEEVDLEFCHLAFPSHSKQTEAYG